MLVKTTEHHYCKECGALHPISIEVEGFHDVWEKLNKEEQHETKKLLDTKAEKWGYADWNHYTSKNPDYPHGEWLKILREVLKHA